MKVLVKNAETRKLEELQVKRITPGTTTMELELYDDTKQVVDILYVYDISDEAR